MINSPRQVPVQWAAAKTSRKCLICVYMAHFGSDSGEVISSCKSQTLRGRSTRLPTHLFNIAVFARHVDELSDGHEHRQHETSGQHDEDASNVLHTQGTGLFAVLLWASVPSPPFLLHHVQLSLFLELQDGDGYLVPVGWACKEP